jgi:hypothetical protein
LIDKGFFVIASGVLAECYQDAIPETEGETEKEIETKTEKRKSATVVACPPDVGLQEWQDWLSLRKAKKAPVTETVLKSARKESEKAGITLNAFLTIWCARGSQGLEASWLKSDDKQSFAKQDELDRRKRWEEMTGRKWPVNDFIDVQPSFLEIEK